MQPLKEAMRGSGITRADDMGPLFEENPEDSCDINQANSWVIECAKTGGNTKWLKILFNKKASPNIANARESGRSAIFFVITRKQKDTPEEVLYDLKILVRAGADVNFLDANGNTPLLVATKEENPDIKVIEFLLDNGAKPDIFNKSGETALGVATEKGEFEIVKLLVEKGADVKFGKNGEPPPFDIAINKCRGNIVEYFLDLKDNENKNVIMVTEPNFLLKKVVELKNPKMTELFIIKRGANVRHRYVADVTILMIAAKDGWVEGIELLIKHGADVASVDQQFKTALVWAIENNQLPAVKTLINNKADCTIYYKGMNLLQYAKSKGFNEIAVHLNSILNPPQKKK
jgi:ankyrin repeat protein